MTSIPSPELPARVAVLGTGLLGTSVALAAARAGSVVRGWDADPQVTSRAGALGAIDVAADLTSAVEGAELIVVCTPIASIARTVVEALRASPDAVVTDVGSIKGQVVREVDDVAAAAGLDTRRFVPGHPMGGSERTGPEHASASVLDAIVWVLTPTPASDPAAVDRLESFVAMVGARPVRLDPERHDRLVAVVSHLPQVASTALMGLAATEEADEPDILLLAAGGFRDLTRLAASSAELWSEILLANRGEVVRAIDLYVERLRRLRDEVAGGAGDAVVATFDEAKGARLRLAAKPQVRAGIAVLQIPIPDRPGALAELTTGLADGDVNIEDLQIVHSPEGGRGLVHLTVAAGAAEQATAVLSGRGFDTSRLA